MGYGRRDRMEKANEIGDWMRQYSWYSRRQGELCSVWVAGLRYVLLSVRA